MDGGSSVLTGNAMALYGVVRLQKYTLIMEHKRIENITCTSKLHMGRSRYLYDTIEH